MASKTQASAAHFLSLNLLFFAMVSGCGTVCVPAPMPPTPKPPMPPTPRRQAPCPPPTPTPSPTGKCPTNTLNLGVCLNVLNGLINPVLGNPPKEPCCSLLGGLTDLEAAVCLCTVLKAGLFNLTLPINLSLLLNYCGKSVPTGFMCP